MLDKWDILLSRGSENVLRGNEQRLDNKHTVGKLVSICNNLSYCIKSGSHRLRVGIVLERTSGGGVIIDLRVYS